MERAGADEMPDEVERKGIGTSATRAATIEKLVRIGFVERKGSGKTKSLFPTHKGVPINATRSWLIWNLHRQKKNTFIKHGGSPREM